MLSGVQWALLSEAILSLGLGAIVLWRGLDRAVSVVLALFFGVWSTLLFLGMPFIEGDLPGWTARLFVLFQAGLNSLTVAFIAVYPPGRKRREKKWILYLALLPVLIASVGALADYYPPFHQDPLAFIYFLLTALRSPIFAFLPGLWFLVHVYRAQDGPRRMQYAGAGAAFLIHIMNDDLIPVLTFMRMGMRIFEMDGLMQVYAIGSILGMTATMVVVALIVIQAIQGRRGWAAGLTVGGWAVIGIALSQLQTMTDSVAGARTVHVAVDMATYLILFYFVARYQILDVALARPSFTTRGLAVAIGLTALITTQVMLEQMVGSAFGWLGAVLAGAAVAATIPLQHRLERARAGARPMGGQYEAFRRMQVYHAAVEGAFQDGQLKEGDNRTLANLRRELNIAMQDHTRLLADLTSRA